MNREILGFLKMNDVEYRENVLLSSLSPIRIGNAAKIIAYPDSEAKIVNLLRFLWNNEIKYKILGRMSNTLPPDEKYEGVLIRTDRLKELSIRQDSLFVCAGASLSYVSVMLGSEGLSGFEAICGIPGSIGGAVSGNAGAFGREMSDLVESVRAYDIADDQIIDLTNAECHFNYRDSIFHEKDFLILSVRFKLIRSDKDSVIFQMRQVADIRKKTQPIDMPSLGSSFKRPSAGVSAAKLIDECGLKGFRIGGAAVSEKHAGFIVNLGRATAKDYIDLSDYVKKCVFEKYKIQLEREIEIM